MNLNQVICSGSVLSNKLKICEIFSSIQGESTLQGYPFVFVRLSGCNLRCTYCDTIYAYNEGSFYEISDILCKVKSFCISKVLLTGGEPLLQENIYDLIDILLQNDLSLSIETNGSIILNRVHTIVKKVVDIKCPSSGFSNSFLFENLDYVSSNDEIKFVIQTEEDYIFASNYLSILEKKKISNIIFSPVFGKLSNSSLAEWILKDRLPVRFQLQLHKILWQDVRGK